MTVPWFLRRPGAAPECCSPYRVVTRDGLMELRCFGDPAAAKFAHPIVLVPPLMARSCVFDLHPRRSMVSFLRARGFSVYLVHWADPGPQERDVRFEDYVVNWLPSAFTAARDDAGAAPTPVGYCLGGLFCAWMLALQPDAFAVAGLALIASPTDMHKMGTWATLLRTAWFPADVFGRTIGNIPGPLCSLTFQMTSFRKSAASWIRSAMTPGGPAPGSEEAAMQRWIRDFSALPQGVYQQLLHDLIRDNGAVAGALRIDAQHVDLAALTLPILAIAGAADSVVSPSSVHAIASAVTSTEVRCMTASGGHGGVLMGARSQAETWAWVADWAQQLHQV